MDSPARSGAYAASLRDTNSQEDGGTTALEHLKPLAQLGDKPAQMLVASIYAYGWGGIPKNDADATYWFRRLGSWGPLATQEGVDPAAPYQLMVAKPMPVVTAG